MFLALSIALVATCSAIAFLAAWVIDLRARSLKQDAELRSLRGTLDRVGQDVVTLWAGERRRLLAEHVSSAPAGLARRADLARPTEPDGAPLSEGAPVLPADPVEDMTDDEPAEAPPPERPMPPDVSTLLVRSITGGIRAPHGASPGVAVISGAQQELVLVAKMLLVIDTKGREAWPDPPAVGNMLMALSDRILAGLELLTHEGGGAPPPEDLAEDDDEPPPSSDSGGGPVTH